MFNYEDAKKFFYDKLTDDLVGKGRMESALYHTAVMIYMKGVEDGMATCMEPCQQDVYVGISKGE